MAQAIGVIRIKLIAGKAAGRTIQTMQAAAPGADPEYTGTIFIDSSDAIVPQAVGIVGIMLKVRKAPYA